MKFAFFYVGDLCVKKVEVWGKYSIYFLVWLCCFIFLGIDGNAFLLYCRGLAFLDSADAFDRRIIHCMEFMFSGNEGKSSIYPFSSPQKKKTHGKQLNSFEYFYTEKKNLRDPGCFLGLHSCTQMAVEPKRTNNGILRHFCFVGKLN